MYYHISSLCPRTDIDMGKHGFCIYLAPQWKELVAKSKLDQDKINSLIDTLGHRWVNGCGYFEHANESIPIRHLIRVTWGKWGAEHIIVPGNACGLDVNTAGCFNLLKGMTLLPHNIDSWTQKQLLLIVFTEIAECVLMNNYLEL